MTASSDTGDLSEFRKNRVWELDFLRGIALVMMMIMHFSYDVRYEFGFCAFAFLEDPWFREFIHPVILLLFVGISGVCCSFSGNNLKRGLKLLIVSAGLTIATLFITEYLGIYCLILFNVLHLLSVSILVYAFLTSAEKKIPGSGTDPRIKNAFSLIIGFIGLYIIVLNNNLSLYDYASDSPLLMPLGISVSNMPDVVDFMPIIPWMGIFLVGSVIGRTCYSEKRSLFPLPAASERKIPAIAGYALSVPEFLGKHSLSVYVIHQPVFYSILYLIFSLPA
ncbi:DUF1624 domain-containing protein [Methanosarcinaceae archaeon]|nr:DUF1624 domain-containing protein [Methanosarcinaceae archaeon]MBQ3620686.1 DUF1624 domain-containing protein [Methanosarcinaceae archaeon]